MSRHYSKPGGFVGRQLIYAVVGERVYGFIAFGSAVRHLPGRPAFADLNEGLNNIFYHVEGPYPVRNFTTKVLLEAERKASADWTAEYGSKAAWFETLVEPPRTGELYRRAGYKLVGTTKGYTCKRIGGASTDGWSGRRVWDTINLRPKLVFYKPAGASHSG